MKPANKKNRFAAALASHFETLGARRIASARGVDTRTVYNWKNGSSVPPRCTQVGVLNILCLESHNSRPNPGVEFYLSQTINPIEE